MRYNVYSHEEALSRSGAADLNHVLASIPSVKSALEMGGWICGGFARHLLLDRVSRAYFRSDSEETPRGDVDVFFNDHATAVAATPAGVRKSLAGFAKELNDGVKIQFVDDPDLIKPTIEETLSSFDIVNCRVAINERYVVIPEGWRELEARKLLQIGRNDSPFLGGRLLKYLNHRGLEGLTDDSYEALTGWLAHAGVDFKEGGWDKHHISGVEGHVKKLRARGLVGREDLIFFISKWKEIIREGRYGESFTYEVDWALNELRIGPTEEV